jgi:ketosteroid isomerase-like protein
VNATKTEAHTMTLTDATGTTEQDAADIRAILDALAVAYRAKDAEAIGRHYLPGARIADLAPPLLRRGFDAAAVQTWLDGWDGPVKIATRDLVVQVDDALAVAHGLQHVAARTRGGERAAWWSRITRIFARTPAGWRITHEHESVPFHMDGSFRAAVDLEP